MVRRPAVPPPLPGPRADAVDAALRFPPRYSGVFARAAKTAAGTDAASAALSQAARDMLARRLPADVAARLIGIAERMAAAAADGRDVLGE